MNIFKNLETGLMFYRSPSYYEVGSTIQVNGRTLFINSATPPEYRMDGSEVMFLYQVTDITEPTPTHQNIHTIDKIDLDWHYKHTIDMKDAVGEQIHFPLEINHETGRVVCACFSGDPTGPVAFMFDTDGKPIRIIEQFQPPFTVSVSTRKVPYKDYTVPFEDVEEMFKRGAEEVPASQPSDQPTSDDKTRKAFQYFKDAGFFIPPGSMFLPRAIVTKTDA